ncbi:alpha-ketoacid dehydrogenase subunit beta [Rhodococcus pseudokoreensis]|uniref:Alpha-ketoacid dehydrogenase subunit beta n=1 Tax=Rhodococcus pseudokoreensis TaxID=2811421 RepID=A0A974ZVJ8_9NOCA|nr:transketolase C-terminal domain-containing protein [Rhodococcus pseudokoreensis]QSE92106.1 alpha-ketoacid dehydrogenase subunit beta [Rhodococcus pseudokoreensis]
MTATVEPELGTSSTKRMTMAVAMNSALDLAMDRDDSVLLLGEDIADPAGGVFKVTKGLSTKYGTGRVRATPISETAIIGAAVGAALAGMRPVAEIMFMDFVTVCLDQITNHAAKLRYMSGGHSSVPLTIRTTVGEQRFGAQHTQSLETWFMHTPGIKVVMPSNPIDAKGLLASCIADNDPCLYIENISLAYSQKDEVPVKEYFTPLGEAAVTRAGRDVTVITYGPAVHTAVAAAEVLAAEGVEVEVIDLRTLMPLDMDTVLASASRTGRALIVHDAHTFLGPGAEIAAQIANDLFGELKGPVRRVGTGFSPAPYAPSGLDFHPTSDTVAAAICELVDY